ncbi:MFS transporter [Streptomyces qinglanensis]|uniref:Predicted arabinose efflux permease, MFS family n=1 Tax=Streptomyces qinglanensis TaxID=943816 RepID=A0A1H9NLP0_9ACTN|nr:MFS transporter [Streptomyces qinglanensis]SER36858.1 Predicted arabinose efflux permease, MFS family [Streptomyces qinglanensis]
MPASGAAAPPGLVSRDFLLLLAATFAVFGSATPMLSIVPLWAEHGGSGHGGAGATTAVHMATTVATQTVTGRILRRIPASWVLGGGALLIGLPCLGYALSAALPWTVAVSALRGTGFGLVTVAGSALAARLAGPGQRGRALGWYGVAVGLPAAALVPAAVWAVAEFGFVPVFAASAALGMLGAPLGAAVLAGRAPSRGRRPARTPGPGASEAGTSGPGACSARTVVVRTGSAPGAGSGPAPVRGLPVRLLAAPVLLLLAPVCALGSLMSFLPLALAPQAAPAALLTLSAALTIGRWAAGEWSDRRGGTGRFMAPCAALCALATAAFAVVGGGPAAPEGGGAVAGTAAAVAAALAFGLGMGALQNDTLVAMFHRTGPERHATISAAWNMTFDSAYGAGALLTGAVAQTFSLSLPAAFGVLAVLTAAVLPAAAALRPRPSHHR